MGYTAQNRVILATYMYIAAHTTEEDDDDKKHTNTHFIELNIHGGRISVAYLI